MKNKYMPTAISMYINYFVHGMGAIILAQNITFLMEQLHTDKAGVSYVISALGLGRLIVLFASGALSDKLGRKPFVLLGMGTYLLFFGGILISPNVTVAFIFALIAGMANSFLDSGTYPALMECFPESTGSANIMIKAFMSAGQFALPMIISILVNNNLYFGYSFVLCFVILVVNGLILFRLPFPAFKAVEKKEVVTDAEVKVNHKANLWVEGICLIIIGFTATATFYIISVWLPTYGQEVAGMVKTSALQLISYYSAGSITSVFITSILVKKWIKQVRFVIIYPFFSLVTLTVLYINPTPTVCIISAFLIGYTAAGGVLQLALTTMSELFPTSKGKITGIVYTASSISSFVMPAITGVISKTSISGIILLDMGIAALGVILALIVNIRYNIVMKKTV